MEITNMENKGGKKRQLVLKSEESDDEEKVKAIKMEESGKSSVEFIPGHHEAEICYGGEADLHKHYTNCKKNPGHVNFIPVIDLNLDHLPSRYRDVIMLEVIKALSALTVLIKVKFTSMERPKSGPCFSGNNFTKMESNGVNDSQLALSKEDTAIGGEKIDEEENSLSDFIPGHHEAEICYGGEADLHKHYTDCKKNPGHVNFIPVKDFTLDHLPSRYHDIMMFDIIKTLSALTVMIKVKYTSLERPKSVPCLSGQYPFYNTRGKKVLRTGTGRLSGVDKYTESSNKGTCPCGKCQHSDTPSKVWGEVYVWTATHVVFDTSEAKQTRCVVGFDDNKSRGVSLDGWKVREATVEGDWCWFSCVSCDMSLVEEVEKLCRRFEELCENIKEKYESFVNVDRLTIIVSHPHGCPKQVSVGHWKRKHERKDIYIKYTYTNCTCPGSSGAFVYMPGYPWWLLSHPHCGSNSVGNYCGEY